MTVLQGPVVPPNGVFEVDLKGFDSRVKLNGVELPGVRDVKVHQPLDGPPLITIEFVAQQIKGITE